MHKKLLAMILACAMVIGLASAVSPWTTPEALLLLLLPAPQQNPQQTAL